MTTSSPIASSTQTPPPASGSTSSAAAAAGNQLGVDYNNFLKLLTAQISNQDPLQPMDSTQFVSQLAQLSQVEQAVQTNGHLETLNTSISAISALSDINLMGRNVTIASDRLDLRKGAAATTYQLASPAQSVAAEITDASGKVVRHLTGLSTQSGTPVALNWDGRDDSGQVLADGIYHLTIQAKDASGAPVSYDTYPTTTVDQVLFDSSGQSLKLGNGQTVSSSQILSVS